MTLYWTYHLLDTSECATCYITVTGSGSDTTDTDRLTDWTNYRIALFFWFFCLLTEVKKDPLPRFEDLYDLYHNFPNVLQGFIMSAVTP